MKGIVVSLCDYSARMLTPWLEAGHECWQIDLQHPPGHHAEGLLHTVGADILDCVSRWFPCDRPPLIGFAFPPCTHTAVSGARHFRTKGPRKAAEAFALIARCRELLDWWGCPWMLEQPVATTATYCGPPSHTFHPHQFAGYAPDPQTDAYTKRTCLWTGRGFIMPEPKPVAPVKVCPQGSWVQKLGGPSITTKNRRAATPLGFARAVFQANAGRVTT